MPETIREIMIEYEDEYNAEIKSLSYEPHNVINNRLDEQRYTQEEVERQNCQVGNKVIIELEKQHQEQLQQLQKELKSEFCDDATYKHRIMFENDFDSVFAKYLQSSTKAETVIKTANLTQDTCSTKVQGSEKTNDSMVEQDYDIGFDRAKDPDEEPKEW